MSLEHSPDAEGGLRPGVRDLGSGSLLDTQRKLRVPVSLLRSRPLNDHHLQAFGKWMGMEAAHFLQDQNLGRKKVAKSRWPEGLAWLHHQQLCKSPALPLTGLKQKSLWTRKQEV